MSRGPPALNLTLAGIGRVHEGPTSARGSPVSSRSKKTPSMGRVASDEASKTPRSTSCEVFASSHGHTTARRRKERIAKADGETPRSTGPKKPSKAHTAGIKGKGASRSKAGSTDRKSPLSSGVRIASPTSSSGRTSRDERRSPLSKDASKQRKKKSAAWGGLDVGVDQIEETARELAACTVQMEQMDLRLAKEPSLVIAQRLSEGGEEIEVQQMAKLGAVGLRCGPQGPNPACKASAELRELDGYIKEAYVNGAPASTVLCLLDECIACTKQLASIEELTHQSKSLLERDCQDLCQIRHDAGISHPDRELLITILNRVIAVAEHLRPSPVCSPQDPPSGKSSCTPQSPLSDTQCPNSWNMSLSPMLAFQEWREMSKDKEELTVKFSMHTAGSGLPASVVSESPPSSIHMGHTTSGMQQATSREQELNEDKICATHFRFLKGSDIEEAAAHSESHCRRKKSRERRDKSPDKDELSPASRGRSSSGWSRGRSSSGDLSDGGSTCSSDAEIRSMNTYLQDLGLQLPMQSESPPDFLQDFLSRLSIEDGRHIDDYLPIDPETISQLLSEETKTRGFTDDELALIAEKKLLVLVPPTKALEAEKCSMCMGKLLMKPHVSVEHEGGAEESEEDHEEEDTSCSNLLLTQLPCKHIFHDACIEKWFCFGRNCPICRHPVLHDAQEETEPAAARDPEPARASTPAPAAIEEEEKMDEPYRYINPIEQPKPATLPTRSRQMIRVPALPLHAVNSTQSEHSTPRTPSAPNSAKLPMSPRSAFTDIKSHRSTTESDATPRSERAGLLLTPRSDTRSDPRCTPR